VRRAGVLLHAWLRGPDWAGFGPRELRPLRGGAMLGSGCFPVMVWRCYLLRWLGRRTCRADGQAALLQFWGPGGSGILEAIWLTAGGRWDAHWLLVAGGAAGHEAILDGAPTRYMWRGRV
jgi:hypothetical protein